MGYHRAGFEVVGVDIKPQPRYPFAFIEADALELMGCLLRGGRFRAGEGVGDGQSFYLEDFAAIHASPPCQAYSDLRAMHKSIERADLVAATRNALEATDKIWVIENVEGAPLRFATIFCGSSFGLGATVRAGTFHQLRRHRLFESNVLLMSPPCEHRGRPVGVYGNGGGNAGRAHKKGVNGFTGNASERREAMGIDWMTRGELSQAIPPAYTEYIGQQLIRQLLSAQAK